MEIKPAKNFEKDRGDKLTKHQRAGLRWNGNDDFCWHGHLLLGSKEAANLAQDARIGVNLTTQIQLKLQTDSPRPKLRMLFPSSRKRWYVLLCDALRFLRLTWVHSCPAFIFTSGRKVPNILGCNQNQGMLPEHSSCLQSKLPSKQV